jgi:hypothetical protein
MKYFYIDSFGKVHSCVETGSIHDIPTDAILWPDGLDFSKALDFYYNEVTSEFFKVDITKQPSEFYKFNIKTMEWEYQKEMHEESLRNTRDLKLLEVDSLVTNPLRWQELSDHKKLEFNIYRKQLLDVPQQSGFPTNIVWPTPPQ